MSPGDWVPDGSLFMDDARIPVELGERAYEVLVGAGLLGRMDELLAVLHESHAWRRAALVTDTNVGPLYSDSLASGLERLGVDVAAVSIEAGEKSKSVASALQVVDFLADSLVTRSDLVVALGGGVVGDLAGFAASIYKRGIDLLQVPTTLMAQVDSSIGGKTGVNLDSGKNLVGTFHQPVAVLCDFEVLATLPARGYASGLAEIAKYSFIRPGAFTSTAQDFTDGLLARVPAVLASVVKTCAAIKAGVVSVDERDTGPRAVLNYGHTLGHALEASTEYEGSYTHGEAVSVGMVFAALVAEALALAEEGLAERHRSALESIGLPVAPTKPAPAFETLAGHIAQDKKSTGGITMVLLQREGEPVVRGGLEPGILAGCYKSMVKGA